MKGERCIELIDIALHRKIMIRMYDRTDKVVCGSQHTINGIVQDTPGEPTWSEAIERVSTPIWNHLAHSARQRVVP